MGKEVKSQWEFGELFPQVPTRQILTVSQLTAQLRGLLEKQFRQIWVAGEITNFKVQTSGHIYFTLKDANAQLSCVLFRGELVANRELLADGQKVTLQGDLTVFDQRGQYRLRIYAVELQGIGALQQKFERLKATLNAEGLFATARKRPIPRFPQSIGLITSETGAAIRDVLHVIKRRNPALRIILASCRVQGDGAAQEIACAIHLLNEWSNGESRRVDVILVARGGGSLEDLWAFNEEIVARAIFHSRIPVVSAVGHEIDFTISDFVADLRAATPSAAAEVLTEGAFASRRKLVDIAQHLRAIIRRQLERRKLSATHLRQRLERMQPRRQLENKFQYLDDLRSRLTRCARQTLRHYTVRAQNLRARFVRFRPTVVVAERKRHLADLQQQIAQTTKRQLERHRHTLDHLASRLRLLSPENVLTRGYSITMDAASGHIIRSDRETHPGQRLRTKLANGEVSSDVSE